MGLFKHAMVSGVCEYGVRAGILAWPNEKVAEDECAKLAARLQGPDMLPEGGLSPKSAVAILGALKTAADRYGHRPSAAESLLRKQAASRDVTEVALEKAAACMDVAAARVKAADAGSLTGVGENSPEAAAQHDQHAELDLKNRPVGEYVVGVGNSDMPQGGVVGKEMPHPKMQANSPAISNSVVEQSKVSSAQKLAAAAVARLKKANDMPPRMGAPPPPPPAAPAEGGGGDDVVAALVAALQDAGIDPASVSPEELAAALQAAQGGGEAPPAEGPPGGGDEESKSAALMAQLKRAAEGSLTEVDKNTPESAAKTDSVAELDQKNRAKGEYQVAQGKSELASPAEGRQESVKEAPKHEQHESTDTTASRETKSAADAAYVAEFKKVAAAHLGALPAAWTKEQKVAAIQQLLAVPPSARAAKLAQLAKG